MTSVGRIINSLKKDNIIQHYSSKGRLIPNEIYCRLKNKKYCDYCHKRMYKSEIHHKIPVESGGLNVESNLMSVHPKCHEKLDEQNKTV